MLPVNQNLIKFDMEGTILTFLAKLETSCQEIEITRYYGKSWKNLSKILSR